MADLDRRTIEHGVPSLTLMERAGTGAAELLLTHYIPSPQNARILVLCGSGNNGGDGLVISRILRQKGCAVSTVLVHSDRYSPDLISNLKQLSEVFIFGAHSSSRGKTIPLPSVERLIRSSTLIVDCLLGTGQHGAPQGDIGELVTAVERERSFGKGVVVSIDIPTGICGSTGEVFSPCFHADATIAIQCVKRGMVQYPARFYCGKIETIDIGIETDPEPSFTLFQPSNYSIIARKPDAHKGHFRKVSVIAGQESMLGASVLASQAALRTGASLVTRILPGKSSPGFIWPEIMHAKISGLTKKGAHDLKKTLSDGSVCVVGPGLGVSNGSKDFVVQCVSYAHAKSISLVLDADALNTIASMKFGKRFSLEGCIITPHPGEAARLLGVSVPELQRDRYFAAKILHEKTGAIVVLKGASTIVYAGMHGTVNSSGNPYLATGGSGDVLSGIIGGLLAQNLPPLDAAMWGAYLHGRAGDIAHQKTNGPIIASDIINTIPEAIGEV